MNLKIRRAAMNDAVTIVEFNRRLALESEGKTLDGSVLKAGVAALLSDPYKGFYTVAECEGEVVGQTLITLEWSDWRNGWFWWIQSVYVREDWRGRGVFKAIFQQLRGEATTGGAIGLRLYVDRDNDRAKKTYRSLGMLNTNYDLLEIFPL
jgi:GNAT superfamily N-acetyltransferase